MQMIDGKPELVSYKVKSIVALCSYGFRKCRSCVTRVIFVCHGYTTCAHQKCISVFQFLLLMGHNFAF